MGETRSDIVPSVEEALLLLLLLLFPVDPMVVLCPPLLLPVLPGNPTTVLRLLSWPCSSASPGFGIFSFKLEAPVCLTHFFLPEVVGT